MSVNLQPIGSRPAKSDFWFGSDSGDKAFSVQSSASPSMTGHSREQPARPTTSGYFTPAMFSRHSRSGCPHQRAGGNRVAVAVVSQAPTCMGTTQAGGSAPGIAQQPDTHFPVSSNDIVLPLTGTCTGTLAALMKVSVFVPAITLPSFVASGRLYAIVRARITAKFGKAMSFHDFCRAASTFLAMEAPEKIGLIPGVLLHASPGVSDRHYKSCALGEGRSALCGPSQQWEAKASAATKSAPPRVLHATVTAAGSSLDQIHLTDRHETSL